MRRVAPVGPVDILNTGKGNANFFAPIAHDQLIAAVSDFVQKIEKKDPKQSITKGHHSKRYEHDRPRRVRRRAIEHHDEKNRLEHR